MMISGVSECVCICVSVLISHSAAPHCVIFWELIYVCMLKVFSWLQRLTLSIINLT